VHKKDIDNLLRFNLFYTNVNDIIYRQGGTYIQDGVSHFYGSELELRARIGLYTTLIATLSTVDGLDKDDEAVADIANQTAGLRLSHKFKNRVVSGTALKYVSSVKRAPSDPRNDLAGYATLDQTFSYRFANGMGVSASVKNLLDADVRYPAPVNTYPDDYPREGRTFWLKAFWEI
jgi:iron complex outermembrane receptor protein